MIDICLDVLPKQRRLFLTVAGSLLFKGNDVKTIWISEVLDINNPGNMVPMQHYKEEFTRRLRDKVLFCQAIGKFGVDLDVRLLGPEIGEKWFKVKTF